MTIDKLKIAAKFLGIGSKNDGFVIIDDSHHRLEWLLSPDGRNSMERRLRAKKLNIWSMQKSSGHNTVCLIWPETAYLGICTVHRGICDDTRAPMAECIIEAICDLVAKLGRVKP